DLITPTRLVRVRQIDERHGGRDQMRDFLERLTTAGYFISSGFGSLVSFLVVVVFELVVFFICLAARISPSMTFPFSSKIGSLATAGKCSFLLRSEILCKAA